MVGLIEITPAARNAQSPEFLSGDATLSQLFAAWGCADPAVIRDSADADWAANSREIDIDWTLQADIAALADDLELAATRVKSAILIAGSRR